jgi:hypothetical protein
MGAKFKPFPFTLLENPKVGAMGGRSVTVQWHKCAIAQLLAPGLLLFAFARRIEIRS